MLASPLIKACTIPGFSREAPNKHFYLKMGITMNEKQITHSKYKNFICCR